MNSIYYHGTSDKFNMKVILPPCRTSVLREDFRKNNMDYIYVTTSLASAYQYAKKASFKFGGSPVVYQVKPIGCLYRRQGCEFICNKALVLKRVGDSE